MLTLIYQLSCCSVEVPDNHSNLYWCIFHTKPMWEVSLPHKSSMDSSCHNCAHESDNPRYICPVDCSSIQAIVRIPSWQPYAIESCFVGICSPVGEVCKFTLLFVLYCLANSTSNRRKVGWDLIYMQSSCLGDWYTRSFSFGAWITCMMPVLCCAWVMCKVPVLFPVWSCNFGAWVACRCLCFVSCCGWCTCTVPSLFFCADLVLHQSPGLRGILMHTGRRCGFCHTQVVRCLFVISPLERLLPFVSLQNFVASWINSLRRRQLLGSI